MTDLPEPLTPADCDLRDFQFMPLDVVRLRDSDIAVMVSGEEFRSAVMLWCAAWHQVPAGSLPNDDRSLASLAGYGRAVGEWLKIKEGALRGWIKCADERLYHPVVCEKARESWDSKLQHAYDKLVDRLRKLNKKREESGLPSVVWPSFDEWKSMGRPLESKIVPAEKKHDSGGTKPPSAGFEDYSDGTPPEKALKGQVREGTGKGEVKNQEQQHNNVPQSRAAEPEGEAERHVQVAVLLRSLGVSPMTGAHPMAMTFANTGATDDQLRSAVEIARDRKPAPQPISPNYLQPILAEILNPPAPRPKPQDAWWRTNEAMCAKARELGIPDARPGEDTHAFKARIQQAIEAQSRVAA
ncbi:DUF1376 domain-containing protein [Cupriavidus necator]|uniref:DUF1376 domain-containing protein n=1 Tax=Cupriavidus necator TaxID=106590 RepID=UPI00148F824D|nr:DUF1376 domain-containing protein [Cupriavidus necator]NOV24180.1 DUF1376 domain-containing protein [Cupriavidus necator]